jgi:hypothetical protein
MKFKIIEFTGSGAGFPSATDTGGGQVIDKFPQGIAKKKKRKKVKLVKRVIPKTIS